MHLRRHPPYRLVHRHPFDPTEAGVRGELAMPTLNDEMVDAFDDDGALHWWPWTILDGLLFFLVVALKELVVRRWPAQQGSPRSVSVKPARPESSRSSRVER